MNYKDDEKFDAWRTRARNAMPSISARVFALRDKSYAGYGFHYSLEKLLGICIRDLNDLESVEYYHVHSSNSRDVIAHRIVLHIIVRELFSRVVEAERSLNDDDCN